MNLKQWEKQDSPYQHFTNSDYIDPSILEDCVEWLEYNARWIRHSSSFFDQFEYAIDEKLSSPFDFFFQNKKEIIDNIQSLCNCQLHDHIKITAHKLVAGQSIGVHTDDPNEEEDYETHRLLLLLPSSGIDDESGIFVLLEDEDSLSVDDGNIEAYYHTPGAAFIIPLNDSSFHCVSEINQGARYSLVFSFWSKTKNIGSITPKKIQTTQIQTTKNQTTQISLSKYLQFLDDLNKPDIQHSSSSIIAHLVGSYCLLKNWGASIDVCLAGLFHNVYGTKAFDHQLTSIQNRDAIKEIIGDSAEEIVYNYSEFDRKTFKQQIINDLKIDANIDLQWLEFANEIEQFYRVPTTEDDIIFISKLADRLNLKYALPKEVKKKL